MAVTVVLSLQIKPESFDEVLAGFKKDLPDTRAFEGCLDVRVVSDQARPHNITLVERWETKANQEKYLAWRGETGKLAENADKMDGDIGLTYYEELWTESGPDA